LKHGERISPLINRIQVFTIMRMESHETVIGSIDSTMVTKQKLIRLKKSVQLASKIYACFFSCHGNTDWKTWCYSNLHSHHMG